MNWLGLYLTNTCNKNCPFCFKIHGYPKPLRISSEDLDIFCAWCKKNEVSAIKIAGGEPTTHPDFVSHINTIKRSVMMPSGLDIISNLVCSEEKLEAFENCSALVNASVPHPVMERNLPKVIAAPGTRVTLSHTVYGMDQPYEHIFTYCKEFKIVKVRLDFARVSLDRENKHVTMETLGVVKERVLEIAVRLAEMGVEINFDCPVPGGTFTEEEYSKMIVRNKRVGNPYAHMCTMVYINPDLTISSCPFRVIDSRRLDEFPDYSLLMGTVLIKKSKRMKAEGKEGAYLCEGERFMHAYGYDTTGTQPSTPPESSQTESACTS